MEQSEQVSNSVMSFPVFLILAISLLQGHSCQNTPEQRLTRVMNITALSKLHKRQLTDTTAMFNILYRPTFDKPSCLDFESGASLVFIRDRYLMFSTASNTFRDIYAGNSTSNYRICMDGYKTGHHFSCIIDEDSFCDGYSSCLQDECGCDDEVFWCGDGSGCVALSQVCDSRPDCLDASDECICQSYQSCRSDVVFDYAVRVTSAFHGEDCFVKPDCSGSNITNTSRYDIVREIVKQKLLDSDLLFDQTKLKECAESNSDLNHHCKNMMPVEGQRVDLPNVYHCSDTALFSVVPYSNSSNKFEYRGFCDGVRNCVNGKDEQNCPNKFYCESDGRPLPLDRTCDAVPDCSDSSDECNNCTMSSYFASPTELIGSVPVLVIVVLLCLTIIPLNIYAAYFHGSRSASKVPTKIDKILCVSLAVFDALMGVYLAIIAIKHVQYSGSYCKYDYVWRSSVVCKLAGALHFGAPHGALQITLLTSFCRYYTCRNTLTGKKIHFRWFVASFVLAMFFNVFLTVLPFIASVWPSALTDVFVHEFYFPDNPIVQRGKKADLAQIISLYQRIDIKITEQYSVKELVAGLQNMTSSKELFSYGNIVAIGYYGTSAMCNPDIFSNEAAIFVFKLLYTGESTFYLALISVCYVHILRESLTLASAVKPDQTPADDRQEGNEKDDQNFFLTIKVTILIGTQLFCWLPVNVAIIASFFSVSIPPIIGDILIGIIIPVNSLLNPIIHTDILKSLFSKTVRQIRKFKLKKTES